MSAEPMPERLGALVGTPETVMDEARRRRREEYEAGRAADREAREAGRKLHVVRDERESDEDRAAREAKQQAWRDAEWVRCCPEKFRGASVDELLPQQNPDDCVRLFLDSPHRSLLLLGPSHHGKSTAQYAIGNQARGRGLTVVAWRMTELIELFKPAPHHERYDETASARRVRSQELLKTADVAIFDDIGREKMGPDRDWWRERLYDILEARTASPSLRTVLSANGPGSPGAGESAEDTRKRKNGAIDKLREQYGDPILSRLMTGSVVKWIEGTPLAKQATWEVF